MSTTTLHAADVADALREIAGYLELAGERYRARAYERAARTVVALEDAALDRLVAERRLVELPGIGSSLARLVEDLWRSGRVRLLDELRARWPRVVAELAALPHVGPERARAIHDALAPASLDEVVALCDAGRVRRLPGFGKVSEARVRAAVAGRHELRALVRLDEADALTRALAAHLRGDRATLAVAPAGPARRFVEVVDELALAVATYAPALAVAERLRTHGLVARAEVAGSDVVRARLARGVSCVVHVARPERFGVALVRATGSAPHLERLARHAGARGAALDALDAPDEAALYAALGLPLLPPEVRDGTDEIAAALRGEHFADLVAIEDVTGAVHCHTTWSDGKHTIAEMARAAHARGLSFLTVTDHSASAGYAGGLGPERLREQWDEIARVQRTTPVRLLRGTESDILADGSLDYADGVLAELDVVIASIHQRHKLDEEGMTRRLVAAMRQPVFKVWGHALGRLLLHRDPVPCRFDEVLDAIAESPVAIEINGDPRRLDLDPERARLARERGARFVLSTDAHSARQLDHLASAVGIARRARIRKREVLNALPADEFADAVRPRSTSARKARALRAAAPSASLSK